MAEEKMFQEAMEAIKDGQRSRARDLLTRLLRTNATRADYWLWMSTVVDTTREKVYCLESALKIDPENQAAQRGLIILGAREADPHTPPAPLIQRKWEDELDKTLERPQSTLHRLWQNPILRLISLLCISAIVIGLVALGIFGSQKGSKALFIQVTPFPTRTFSATLTSTTTRTPVVRSPTPTYIGPTPLWMFLEETYTPVPLYVNTPHPVIEAYRVAMRAYVRGDYKQMLDFIQQASQADPNSTDFLYYLGEANRLLGNYDQAIDAYERAMQINPNFGPAYLGRAKARLGIFALADVTNDLDRAIETDPGLVDAYLERAAYAIRNDELESALEDLQIVEYLFPESPLLYMLRAQVNLLMGDNVAALENAQRAYDLDRTLLPAYLTLARAFLANDLPEEAAKYIETYLRYSPQNYEAWLVAGMAYLQSEDYAQALGALDKAISLNEEAWEVYYYRGKAHLGLGEGQQAVNDLIVAVQHSPSNFIYTFDLADALWKANRLSDAYRTFMSAEQLASEAEQLAMVYYYRAQVAEQAGSLLDAKADWALLLDLPENAVLEAWRAYAQERWDSLHPPTATRTSTKTPLPTASSTATITPIPTITKTPTPSQTITPFTD